MTAELQINCSGCDAKATSGPVPISQVFASLPEGWVFSDPYTAQSYCPDCWAKIIAPPSAHCTTHEVFWPNCSDCLKAASHGA